MKFNLKEIAILLTLGSSIAVQATIVTPQQYSINRGKWVSGNLASLFSSDNDFLVVKGGPRLSSYDTPVDVRMATLCSTPNPQRLILNMETKVNSPNLIQYIEMFEWNSNQWVTLDQRQMSLFDTTTTIDIPSCWRFAKPITGEMQLRFWVSNNGPVVTSNWAVSFDTVHWIVDPN